MPICPACTSELEDLTPYCPACGSSLGSAPVDDATTMLTTPSAYSRAAPPLVASGASSAAYLAADSSPGQDGFGTGSVLGARFRIIGRLGRGGMGDVYRADDLVLGQPVALKVLPRDLATNADRQARFYGEVRIARTVSHPNVCRVYDVGTLDGQPYMSMELVDGDDLASLLRRIGRLPADKALDVARQLCAGLAAAHEKGVLHRDLKPANVIIDAQGKVRITDFGLAVLAEDAARDRVRAGTPAYMAPEQLAHNAVSVQSDIYSLGLVLYETFTGRRAFGGDTLLEVQRQQESDKLASPSTILEDIDPVIERAILRCLEKDPAERPASALAVAASLPGGDPLAAALAAGEMPSPELVAAAGGAGAMGRRAAWSALAVVVAGTAVLVGIAADTQFVSRVGLATPPAALEDRARGLLRQLGHDAQPEDRASGFLYDRDAIRWMRDRDKGPTRWRDLPRSRAATVVFWYRQSPRHIQPVDPRDGPGVGYWDPPPEVSGMASVLLDPRGRLQELLVVPPQVDSTQGMGATPAPDWPALFAAAELDPARFRSVQPTWVPHLHCDARFAWEGTEAADPAQSLHIEAGAYGGKPSWFQVIGPWTRAGRMEPRPRTAGEKVGQAIVGVLLFSLIIGGALLARRNVRTGHGDRRGATRLASYVAFLTMASWLLVEHHATSVIDEWQIFWPGAGLPLFLGSVIWVLYVALEPYVRKRWPDSLIGWNRLLAGRFRDPRVGRDILIGIEVGIVLQLLGQVQVLLSSRVGLAPTEPVRTSLEALRGLRWGVATLLDMGASSTFTPMIFLFLLSVLRRLFRSQKVALLALVALFTVITVVGGEDRLVTGAIVAIAVGALLFTMIRFGLLAAVGAQFASLALESYPITADAAVWYAPATGLVVAVLTALALYGFRTALAGQPAFKSRLLAE
jgi:serine/threonine-protein kinase